MVRLGRLLSRCCIPVRPRRASALKTCHPPQNRDLPSAAGLLQWGRQILKRSPSPRRELPSSGFDVLDATEKFEEEEYAWYSALQYYPVRLGEVFNSRYQVLGKLGYGAHSTVWLCRDLLGHKYVTLKVCERDSVQTTREIEVYKYLNTITARHVGRSLVRSTLDTFEIRRTESTHQCLVHKPMGMSLSDLRELCESRRFDEELLRMTLVHILLALDFLHTTARVIHSDVHPDNILLEIEDESILVDFEEAERTEPCPRKIDEDRVIYLSRELADMDGRPVLCDFGEARFGKQVYNELIQPFVYRAPEVDLQIPWDNKVDIWNIGVMAWHLFQNKHLIDGTDANGKDSREHKLAELIALLGPPPKHFLERSEIASEYFDEQGRWKGTVDIPTISLEDSEKYLEGDQKAGFLQFMRKMLQWVPEERQSAKELLGDPWLCAKASK